MQDYGMRIYDGRLGRFLSTDPLTQQHPELTPYQFSSNNPIAGVDMDGLEFLTSYKAYQTQKFNAEILYQTTPKPVSNNAASSPPKPVITPVHSEASIPLQQLKARANAMRPVSPEEQNKRNIVEMTKETEERVGTVSEAKPPGPANEFEAGAVQGTQMAAIAVAAEACPTCFVAYGSSQVYNGIQNGNTSQVVSGTLNMSVGIGVFGKILDEDIPSPEVEVRASLKGMANPTVRAAIELGNKVHYDQLNGGTFGSVGLPSELQAKYPQTQFYFTPRGAKGADVEVVGGLHPSQYSNSTWAPGNNFGDFKPGNASGARTFQNDIKSGKLPTNTQLLNYDTSTGALK